MKPEPWFQASDVLCESDQIIHLSGPQCLHLQNERVLKISVKACCCFFKKKSPSHSYTH